MFLTFSIVLQCHMCSTSTVMTFTRTVPMDTPTAMTLGGRSTVLRHAGSARVRNGTKYDLRNAISG